MAWANVLRTNQHPLCTLPEGSARARSIAVLARAYQDALWRRTELVQELRPAARVLPRPTTRSRPSRIPRRHALNRRADRGLPSGDIRRCQAQPSASVTSKAAAPRRRPDYAARAVARSAILAMTPSREKLIHRRTAQLLQAPPNANSALRDQLGCRAPAIRGHSIYGVTGQLPGNLDGMQPAWLRRRAPRPRRLGSEDAPCSPHRYRPSRRPASRRRARPRQPLPVPGHRSRRS
jgi:hypothetical protein